MTVKWPASHLLVGWHLPRIGPSGRRRKTGSRGGRGIPPAMSDPHGMAPDMHTFMARLRSDASVKACSAWSRAKLPERSGVMSRPVASASTASAYSMVYRYEPTTSISRLTTLE